MSILSKYPWGGRTFHRWLHISTENLIARLLLWPVSHTESWWLARLATSMRSPPLPQRAKRGRLWDNLKKLWPLSKFWQNLGRKHGLNLVSLFPCPLFRFGVLRQPLQLSLVTQNQLWSSDFGIFDWRYWCYLSFLWKVAFSNIE